MPNITQSELQARKEQLCRAGEPIGRAISTEREPNTTSHFFFWCSGDERRLQLGNIVAAVGPDDLTFGVITEMRSITDVQSFLADYLSHDYGRPDAAPPSELTEITVVKCAFLSNISEQARPVGRATMHFPTEEGLRRAMALDPHGVPVGVFENGDGTNLPIALNQNYIIGPEGAHLNIAGISGLASKTSFALFTIKSVLHTNAQALEAQDQGEDGMEPRRVAVVLFNVKSRDLLYVDQPNPQLSDGSELAARSREIYEQCGISPEPFSDVVYFAPSDPNDPGQPQTRRRNRPGDSDWLPVHSICWEYRDIRRYIPSFFDKDTWNDQAVSFWENFTEHLDRQDIHSFQGFYAELGNIAQQVQRGGQNLQMWQGVAGVTVLRWRRNLGRLRTQYRGLLAASPEEHRPIPMRATADRESIIRAGRVIVVDIQRLPDNGQRLVFNKIVSDIQWIMEDAEQRRSLGVDGVVIFVDELNKFAPSSIGSPLKTQLIDITARGRSSNVALIGAEQFASEVDKQVFDNCATRVFGRTGSSEISGQVYRRLSNEMRVKLISLPQGVMLVDNNRFAEPLLARFPLPPCVPGDRFED